MRPFWGAEQPRPVHHAADVLLDEVFDAAWLMIKGWDGRGDDRPPFGGLRHQAQILKVQPCLANTILGKHLQQADSVNGVGCPEDAEKNAPLFGHA